MTQRSVRPGEFTARPRWRRRSREQIWRKIIQLTAQNLESWNRRDKTAVDALHRARNLLLIDPHRAQDRLWATLLEADARYIKTRRVNHIACFNALAWAGGYTRSDPRLHLKRRVIIEVDSPVSRPARA